MLANMDLKSRFLRVGILTMRTFKGLVLLMVHEMYLQVPLRDKPLLASVAAERPIVCLQV